MSKLKIVIFLGSTREGRLADRVLKFVRNSIGSEHDVIVFGKYMVLNVFICSYAYLLYCVLH